MKKTGQRLMIISFVLAVVAAGMIFVYLRSVGKPREEVKTTTVYVAAETIPPRTLIEGKMLKEVQVSLDSIFQGYISNSSDIVGKYTKETILKNEGFQSEKLTTKDGEELSLKIEPDHRAISISVSGNSGVSDLLKPGDSVDIIIYLEEKKDGNKVLRPDISKILLQGVRLLAVDRDIHRDQSSTEVEIPASFYVTISVPTSELEKVVLAENIGSLKLALRPLSVEKINETKGITWEELLNISGTAKTQTESASNKKPIRYTVKQGDTLRSISETFYGDQKKYLIIKDANNIKDENQILTGKTIIIPVLK